MAECNRAGCTLTAMWQVSMEVRPNWDSILMQTEPAKAFLGLLVCGLHKDEVRLEEILDENSRTAVINAMTGGHADLAHAEVAFIDISDGRWRNPRTAKWEPISPPPPPNTKE